MTQLGYMIICLSLNNWISPLDDMVNVAPVLLNKSLILYSFSLR